MRVRTVILLVALIGSATYLMFRFFGVSTSDLTSVEESEKAEASSGVALVSPSPAEVSAQPAVDVRTSKRESATTTDPRPELFSGSREAQDFLAGYWGPQWPSVQQWAVENNVAIPTGVWNFDEQLLPTEARAVIEAKIAERILGRGDLEGHIAKEVAKLTRTPLDDALRGHQGGPIELPARGGATLLLEPEDLPKFESHLSVGRQRASGVARQIVEDGIQTALDALAAGKTNIVPLLEYIEGPEPFSKTNSEWLYTSSYGMWIGRLKVDLTQGAHYALLRDQLDIELRNLKEFYWEVVELYR